MRISDWSSDVCSSDLFDQTEGYTGAPRGGTEVICTNPLTGTSDAAAPASANLGALFPSADLSTADILPGRISARCEGRGILSVGPPPNMVGNYVLPSNNYHVFDYSLFWANIRADAQRRSEEHTSELQSLMRISY